MGGEIKNYIKVVEEADYRKGLQNKGSLFRLSILSRLIQELYILGTVNSRPQPSPEPGLPITSTGVL